MKIKIKIKGYYKEDIIKSIKEINKIYNKEFKGILLIRGPIHLPKKETLYTILKSPHVNKKARDQFFKRTHTQIYIIEIQTFNIYTIQRFILKVQQDLSSHIPSTQLFFQIST